MLLRTNWDEHFAKGENGCKFMGGVMFRAFPCNSQMGDKKLVDFKPKVYYNNQEKQSVCKYNKKI